MAEPSRLPTALPESLTWDPAALRGLFGDDSRTIVAVVATFLNSMRVSMAEADQALREDRRADLVAVVHRIKGAARMSGAMAFAQAAETVERSAPDATRVELNVAMLALRRQWETVERLHQEWNGCTRPE